jgi:hypothetical protein
MHTSSARSARELQLRRGTTVDPEAAVASTQELGHANVSRAALRAALDAGRWQRVGRAIVLHNGPLTREQQCRVALVNCGPRSILTGLIALERLGLTGWPTDSIDVLAPLGVAPPRLPGVSLKLHTTRRAIAPETIGARRIHRVAPAIVLATDSMSRSRTACGLLAAGVQQRLTTPAELARAVQVSQRTRHRGLLRATIADIGMGAQALSKIDFGQLCRRYRLPMPQRQAVRVERDGRRRYLDALWPRAGDPSVAAEVDGALHLEQRQWWSDQLRQNELMLSGTLVLRFPSALIRTEPALVANQLRRALGPS